MNQLLTKAQLQPYARFEDLGPDRPFQILGLLETHELGDLIANVVFLSTLANQFDHARLHVKFRDVRPYSREILLLSPWISLAEPFRGEWPRFVRRLFPPTKLLKPLLPMGVGSQKGKKAYLYDMIVTSLMAREDAVHALPDPVPLRIPREREDELVNRLKSTGLRSDTWFAVFHHRESGYRYRPGGAHRDSDTQAFDSLVDHIIALGGQAVRLGHPGMTPFRPRAGFVDLSRYENAFLLHAAAVAHARFMIAGPSGPMILAPAFAVPHAFVDVVDMRGYWQLDRAHILTHEVTTPAGEVLRNASLQSAGLLDIHLLSARAKAEPQYRIRKASAQELHHVADHLHARTQDCPGWRTPAPLHAGRKPNAITWPLQLTYATPWLDIC